MLLRIATLVCHPYDDTDALGDLDGDTISNLAEFLAGTNPLNSDSDDDGLPDQWEILWGLDPNSASDSEVDCDHDLVVNTREQELETAPVGLHRLNVRLLPQELQGGSIEIIASDSEGNHLLEFSESGSTIPMYLSRSLWGDLQVHEIPVFVESGTHASFSHMSDSGMIFGKAQQLNGFYRLVSWKPGDAGLTEIGVDEHSYLSLKDVSANGAHLLFSSNPQGTKGIEVEGANIIASYSPDWELLDGAQEHFVNDFHLITNNGELVCDTWFSNNTTGEWGAGIGVMSATGDRVVKTSYNMGSWNSYSNFRLESGVSQDGILLANNRSNNSSGLSAFYSDNLFYLDISGTASDGQVLEASARASQVFSNVKLQNGSSGAMTLKGIGYIERGGAALKISALPILPSYQIVADPSTMPRAGEILPDFAFPIESASLNGEVHGFYRNEEGSLSFWTLSNVTDYNNDGLADDWQESVLAAYNELHGTSETNLGGFYADFDGDGITNGEEFLNGLELDAITGQFQDVFLGNSAEVLTPLK